MSAVENLVSVMKTTQVNNKDMLAYVNFRIYVRNADP